MEFTLSVRSFQYRDATYIRLAAEFSFRTHLRATRVTSDAKRVQLVHHRIDSVLDSEFRLDVYGDLFERSPFATAVVTSAMLRT